MPLKSALGSVLINGNSAVVDIPVNICMIGRTYKLIYKTTWSNCAVLHQGPPGDNPTYVFIGSKKQSDPPCLRFPLSRKHYSCGTRDGSEHRSPL